MKQYIDINKGMIKTQKYYWFLKYWDKTETSFLSEMLGVDSSENPQWRIVNTLSIGHRNSPHYVFHEAIWQVTQFKLTVPLYNIGEQDSKAIARRIIELWKENQSDNKADEYLRQINMQYGKDS